MRNNRTSVAVLIGTIAVALHDSSEAFAPTLITTTLRGDCRCSTTEASLFPFRRKKNSVAADDLGQSAQQNVEEEVSSQLQNSRRNFLSATAAVSTASLLPLRAYASNEKQLNLSNDDLKQIILSDIVDKTFLVTADITRSVYDESASFTDEIDVYTMDKWIKGTKSLFVPSGSRVSLVGDVDVSQSEVSFRFDEDLMFNM